ncbi:DUF4019 domain-containing protein [Vreelandella aquamarina]|uniref:DUF4019 domain-containing protein n=1 Tax=Vreelandella aquamarina TaxID=77097 RepID=A0A857GJS8_9GAMM|nr:DUF4019 domain-containing protein [Halomonas meridiana]QHD49539.1 hypothetical protein CTT34_07460 [Halomonas meridiana]
MPKPLALFLSALLLALTTYAQASSVEAAEAAALAWLEAIDQGEYEQAWEKSSPLLKTPLSPTMLQRVVTLARSELGSVESRRRIRMSQYTSMPGAPRNDYKEFAFQTQFTNNQRVVEVVTPHLEEGTWRVSGYYVQ